MRKFFHRLFLILARTIDHRVGKNEQGRPDVPVLTLEEALISFFIRFVIVLINFATCAAVIANIVHHW